MTFESVFPSLRLANLALGATLAFSATFAFAQAKPLDGKTVKIAWIDPLTGLLGPVGINQLATVRFMVEKYNVSNPAGVKFEIIPFDNKGAPTESLNALKSAIDQDVHYIMQGNSSAVALALVDAINKHNERNPGKEVVYLNTSAVDPDLTNSKCSFWHFRYDADTSMKMEAMTTFIKDMPEVKNVYLFSQNYSHGVQVNKFAKEMLAQKRPDIKIVGEDLHPIAQVRDFAPYIAKIKASGADSVITGNWGTDLSLLIKAANEGGYNGKFFTYYATVTGTPAALGTAGAGRVYFIGYGHYHMGGQPAQWLKEFNQKTSDDLYTFAYQPMFEMLGIAMAKTKSTDPVKVAFAMEGLRFKSFNGDVEMRKSDHQLQQPLYMTVWQKVDAKHAYTAEKTGMTFVPLKEYPSYVSSTPTSCQMKRPSS
jgi:branched-chain amino acid transport system substrate-binding protein